MRLRQPLADSPMKPTRRTNARMLIGALRRRIRTREAQLAKARRAVDAAQDGERQARAVADALAVDLQRVTAERADLRRIVHDLSQRLATYRREAIGTPKAPAMVAAPKKTPRVGNIPAALKSLELD